MHDDLRVALKKLFIKPDVANESLVSVPMIEIPM